MNGELLKEREEVLQVPTEHLSRKISSASGDQKRIV
jgi:hypothetical protein